MGLCPFHNERTPSFSVNAQRNFCYCFSCKKGGSPINFIMEKEGMSYHDALLYLAKRYGIKVEEKELTDEEREQQNMRDAMFAANEWAMNKMAEDLKNTEEGRDVGLQYFYQRGLTEEAITQFRLGYSIDKQTHLSEAAVKSGYDINTLKELGLVGTSQRGQDYDRFRGRVIFPVMNSAGKVVAFGGRDLKGGIAKYINSPESSIYKKSNELYGIFQARSAIVKENKCYLVEGYLDVIGMWQAGLKNVVASSGTALTDNQINLIHRFTPNVTLIYDGDGAGIKAAMRGIDMLLTHGMDVKVLLLPDGHDPDSFAKAHTPDEFQKYVKQNETDILKFKAKILTGNLSNDPQQRIEAVRSMVESLACISDKIKLDVYIQECSSLLGVAEATIAESVKELKRKKSSASRLRNIDQPEVGSDVNIAQLQPSSSVQTQQGPEALQSATTAKEPAKTYPMLPLEKNVLQYCLKYGYMNFCTTADVNDNEIDVNVIDYIADELSGDNLEFSVEIYARIFNILLEMKDEFRAHLDARIIDIDKELAEKEKKGLDEIASKDLDMKGILREESRLKEEIDILRNELIASFSREYPARELASHEDPEIRRLVIELIKEKHQLSNIFNKDSEQHETIEQKLSVMLPRAMEEWKSELVGESLNKIIKRIDEASRNGDVELVSKLQQDMITLHRIRAQMAKNIGDRILGKH